jgi:hypothetical protein
VRSSTGVPSSAFRALLAGAIDYAGLFPPAALDMASAVREYAAQRSGPDAWALGRFVVPAARLEELARATPEAPGAVAQLSVLLGGDPASDLRSLEEFNRRHGARGIRADTVETRADSSEAVGRVLELVPRELTAYLEVPVEPDPAPLLAAIARGGGRAKVRTGGVTADAFPTPAALLRFLRGCVAAGLPFKATAGLHHPLRAEYRLTYAPDSPTGTMFGFANVFLAAAFLHAGMRDDDALRLLEERDARAFRMDADGVEWRGHRLTRAEVEAARGRAIVSFGSCSFSEPVGEARGLGWLSPA